MAIGIPSVEVAATGKTQVPEAVNSYKAEMKVGNAWSSNQRRYATAKEADEAGKGSLSTLDFGRGLQSGPKQ